ncbi:MAG: hypothetical protein V4739_09390 [Pseudomonadota bacterium]
MLTFLRRTKDALSRPSGHEEVGPGRTTRDWLTTVLPRLTAPVDSEAHDAQLILGGLRLILSRHDSAEHSVKLGSAVKLESMLCEYLLGGDRSVLSDTRVMALSLTETRHLLDPEALRALQRWYRSASDTVDNDDDPFKKTQSSSKH